MDIRILTHPTPITKQARLSETKRLTDSEGSEELASAHKKNKNTIADEVPPQRTQKL